MLSVLEEDDYPVKVRVSEESWSKAMACILAESIDTDWPVRTSKGTIQFRSPEFLEVLTKEGIPYEKVE